MWMLPHPVLHSFYHMMKVMMQQQGQIRVLLLLLHKRLLHTHRHTHTLAVWVEIKDGSRPRPLPSWLLAACCRPGSSRRRTLISGRSCKDQTQTGGFTLTVNPHL